MKRIVYVVLAGLWLGMAAGAWAQDSLGDYARKVREQQKPASPTTKVWTNDDIGSAGPAGPAVSAAGAPAAPAAAAAKDSKKEEKEKSADDLAKDAAEFKSRIAEQKTKIAEIQRNIDVSNREFKLHSIDWYTQAGNALLDPKKYKDETDRHNKEIADLQKQLADANAEIEKIREEIRKAGLSSSVGE